MLKICFVASSPFTINAFLTGHIRELSKHFLITIVCAQKDSLASLQAIENVNIINLEIGRKPNFSDFISVFKLSKILRELKPICVMSISPKAGLLTMLSATLASVPNRIHFFTGQVWANKVGLKKLALMMFDALIITISSKCFVDSLGQLNYLKKELSWQIHKLALLGPGPICGVDLNRFKKNKFLKNNFRASMGFPEEAIVALYLGRINREKGVLELFKAFEHLINSGINSLYLLVVGPTDGVDIECIEQILAKCGDRIKFEGSTATPESAFLVSDFLVLPSQREGFGMVVAEAGAASIPSIVTDIYGLHDVVRPGITGLKVPVNDYLALADAIKYLTINPQIRNNLGEASNKFVVNNFSSELVTKTWVNFFKSLA